MLRSRSAGTSRIYDQSTWGTTSLIGANISKMMETPTLAKYPFWIAFLGHSMTSSPKWEASGSFCLITDLRRRILNLPPSNVSTSRLVTRVSRSRSPDSRGRRNVLPQLRKPRPRISCGTRSRPSVYACVSRHRRPRDPQGDRGLPAGRRSCVTRSGHTDVDVTQ
jgi:hypothetical protein